ncbi:MAG: DNA-binding protein WhiA [Lachnobacterium sp.]|nr:DNA-binding protein WhiA [Lachnobacterium sp.]
MSFSKKVKIELRNRINKESKYDIAELVGIISSIGEIEGDYENLVLDTDNPLVYEQFALLIKNNFPVDVTKKIGKENCKKILKEMGYKVTNDPIDFATDDYDEKLFEQDEMKKAFLRGVFLAIGSISDPHKSYHLEMVCCNNKKALRIQKMMIFFNLDAKIVLRKNHYVVYLKEGSQICDFLSVIGAFQAMLELENVRILKDMRNTVNRKVNCETANIGKTVNAALRQIEDIELIKEKNELINLPDQLKEIAILRLENPDSSLKDLGTLLDPPVGKSGVNHRLRKISLIAEELRNKNAG